MDIANLSRKQRTALTITAIIAATAILLVYALIDPSTNHYPRCAFKMLTGLSCPGCGSQRALHALLHGNLDEAWSYNALFVIELPLIALLLLLSCLPGNQAMRLCRLLCSQTFILLLLATIIIWTIVRNTLLEPV